ncbi:Putative ski2-type helicase [Thermoplasmatales archaeon]|nr:Putative ski2-type helicase [Thermoplasmatales archaeon]
MNGLETFSLLDSRIVAMLAERGIETPTMPQAMAMRSIIDGKDVLLLSPTGSGKTEAAILPLMHILLRDSPPPVSVLYITPLRALNRDMLQRLIDYGRKIGISVQVRHSDIGPAEKREILKNPAGILITTPESLQIMLNGKNLREIIKNVRYVVADELHELAQNERGSQFSLAMERLRHLTGGFQAVGLSATVGNAEELSLMLNGSGKVEIIKAEVEKKMDATAVIPESSDKSASEIMGCDEQYAGAILYVWNLIDKNPGTIVFVNTRSIAEDISFRIRLMIKDPPIMVHHGSLSRDTREAAERDFKSGKIKAIISTSSLELGIDIGLAKLVIQFNSPRQINKLLQRVGRSGHSLEKVSRGIVVCTDVIELEEALAIIDQANAGVLEDILIMKNSLATIANQIISEIHFSKELSADALFSQITAAYPFRTLSHDDFTALLEFLARTRKIWNDPQVIRRRAGTLSYYLENISMIPSEKNYRVIDIGSRKFIGTLDERYVVNEIEPGSYFVIKGSTWRTVRIDEDRIFVEAFPTVAIAPKWSGEDIPVLPDVMDNISEMRKNNRIPENTDSFSRALMKEWYSGQLALKERVIIETKNGEVIVQIISGTRANFALAEILTSFMVSVTGQSVEMDYSPYHIYMRCSRQIMAADVEKIIRGIDPGRLEDYIRAVARRSRFFNLVFLYEAKKFGVISKDADISRIRFEKIVDSYLDTPVYTDSVRKLITNYMDLDTLRSFLSNIGNVEFVLKNSISSSSSIFLRHYSEKVMPLKPTKSILESVKTRLMNEETVLYCTACGNIRTMKIREIRSIKCPDCGSYLVASLSRYDREELQSISGKESENSRIRKRISKNAHLVKERGMVAIMTMAARGIGAETASRILEVSYHSEEDIIRAILTAEVEFAKNKRYWD